MEKMHNDVINNLILNNAVNGNILPLTSICNMRCLFCSHKQNPAEVQVYHIRPRELADIKETLAYMDPACPVVIGESVTRIIEGEPFTHPQIEEVLRLIREKLPLTPLRITTNGSLLDRNMVGKLAALTGVELNLSLNSASPEARKFLMGDTQGDRSVQSPLLLMEHGVAFHGSVVAMPHLVGWQDIRNTVQYLADCGAITVRVFLPGFTRLAPSCLRFAPELLAELSLFLENLRQETATPLLCEPPVISDFTPVVTGVINHSPAQRAGVNRGDVVTAFNGVSVLTRVEAFEAVYRAASPELKLVRNGKRLTVRLDKNSGEASGLVMEYDLQPRLCEEIRQLIGSRRAGSTVLLTGVLAAPLIRMAVDKFCPEPVDIRILATPNHFFGGSIQAAGLLTVEDFSAALRQYFTTNNDRKPDLILLPGLAFDNRGRDLTGRSYAELEEKYGVETVIVS